MSFALTAAVWRLRKGEVPDAPAKLVLAYLADCADDQGFAWPSLRQIAEFTLLNPATVCRKLAALEHAGLIRREGRKRPDGADARNIYAIQLDIEVKRVDRGRVAESDTPRVAESDTPVSQRATPFLPGINPTIPPCSPPVSEGASTATPMTPGWEPSEDDRAWAIKQGFPQELLDDAIDEFRDYWLGVDGKRGCKRDWSKTFKNRIRARLERVAFAGRRGATRRGASGIVAAARRFMPQP